jgi:hypothetical protein
MYTKQRMTRQDLLNTCGAVASAFLPLRLVNLVACLIVVEETPIEPGPVRFLAQLHDTMAIRRRTWWIVMGGRQAITMLPLTRSYNHKQEM